MLGTCPFLLAAMCTRLACKCVIGSLSAGARTDLLDRTPHGVAAFGVVGGVSIDRRCPEAQHADIRLAAVTCKVTVNYSDKCASGAPACATPCVHAALLLVFPVLTCLERRQALYLLSRPRLQTSRRHGRPSDVSPTPCPCRHLPCPACIQTHGPAISLQTCSHVSGPMQRRCAHSRGGCHTP